MSLRSLGYDNPVTFFIINGLGWISQPRQTQRCRSHPFKTTLARPLLDLHP